MARRKKRMRLFMAILVIVIIGLLALFNSYDGVFVDNSGKQAPTRAVGKVENNLPVLPPLKIPPRPASDSIKWITPTKYFSGIFWKIEKPGYKPSWLLGTIHVDDLRVLGLVDRVTAEQFKKAQMLCTEVKLDYVAKIKMTTAMFYKNRNRSLRQDIGDTLFDRVVAVAAKKNIPEATLNRMKPWAAWVLLVMPIPKRDTLDEKLFKTAILKRKKLCGLENLDDHLSVFTKTPLAEQIKFLQYAVDNIDKIKKQSAQLIEIYLKGNLKEVFSLMDESPMSKDKELLNDYFYRLVIKRNYIMVNSMLPKLRKGNVFFAVGALHLTGKAGVLQLLEKKGFKVIRLH